MTSYYTKKFKNDEADNLIDELTREYSYKLEDAYKRGIFYVMLDEDITSQSRYVLNEFLNKLNETYEAKLSLLAVEGETKMFLTFAPQQLEDELMNNKIIKTAPSSLLELFLSCPRAFVDHQGENICTLTTLGYLSAKECKYMTVEPRGQVFFAYSKETETFYNVDNITPGQEYFDFDEFIETFIELVNDDNIEKEDSEEVLHTGENELVNRDDYNYDYGYNYDDDVSTDFAE